MIGSGLELPTRTEIAARLDGLKFDCSENACTSFRMLAEWARQGKIDAHILTCEGSGWMLTIAEKKT